MIQRLENIKRSTTKKNNNENAQDPHSTPLLNAQVPHSTPLLIRHNLLPITFSLFWRSNLFEIILFQVVHVIFAHVHV